VNKRKQQKLLFYSWNTGNVDLIPLIDHSEHSASYVTLRRYQIYLLTKVYLEICHTASFSVLSCRISAKIDLKKNSFLITYIFNSTAFKPIFFSCMSILSSSVWNKNRFQIKTFCLILLLVYWIKRTHENFRQLTAFHTIQQNITPYLIVLQPLA
jgi:hypothetical protein